MGKAPFRGSSADAMYQRQRVRLRVEQLGGVPAARRSLEVLLEKDPARRFQSPAELLKVMPMARDAIDSLNPLMKPIRVFISSTADIQKERILPDLAIRSVAGEFNVPVSVTFSNFQRLAEENGEPETEPENHPPLVLCPHFLFYMMLPSSELCRDRSNTAEFDLVISILWSRLGVCWTRPDDAGWRFTRLGTEYEVAGR